MASDVLSRLAADLAQALRQHPFSGVALVHEHGVAVFEHAMGLASRAEDRPITAETRLATASVTKGFTALAVVSMIEEGRFDFDTRLVDVIGEGLPVIDQTVTIEHLLGHTSGVGDYLDEDALESADDYVLDVPVHTLLGPESYVPLLNRHPQVEPPGTKFRYNNAGYLMLALAIERAGRRSYHDEVRSRVFEPAAMQTTDFLRSDRLPAATALGYLSDGRTNVLHLPVIGTGDGGAYTTAPDMIRFWDALFDGSIVSRSMVEKMTTTDSQHFATASPTDDVYGLGFWIAPGRTAIVLEGHDAGVSMRSGADPVSGLSFCLVANNSADVWPIAAVLNKYLFESAHRN